MRPIRSGRGAAERAGQRASGQRHARALAARIKRQQDVVRSLEQVELTGVALPGDEPIVYPQAERWQELSARRVKYARTDFTTPRRPKRG